MRRSGDLEQARVQGSLAAARELRRLKVDQSRAIDIFRIIVDADLWLLFQPMQDLLGAYLRQNGGGVLINARRPRSVQRLTAAHEYGHHVLKHQGSLDDENDIDDPSAARRLEEAAAQAFAMDFLMPLQLVNKLWTDLSIPQVVEAYHAYVLSLSLGTSYRAAVHHLVALGKISKYKAAQFLNITPKQIKQQIGRGMGPANPWAEVWPVDETQNGQVLEIGVDDEVRLSLPESPSTGYLWTLDGTEVLDLRGAVSDERQERDASEGDASRIEDGHLALIRSEFDSADALLVSEGTGGRGNRYMTFRALRRGDSTLRLSLRRPWQKRMPQVPTFVLHLRVIGKPTGDAEQGYLDAAKEQDFTLSGRAA